MTLNSAVLHVNMCVFLNRTLVWSHFACIATSGSSSSRTPELLVFGTLEPRQNLRGLHCWLQLSGNPACKAAESVAGSVEHVTRLVASLRREHRSCVAQARSTPVRRNSCVERIRPRVSDTEARDFFFMITDSLEIVLVSCKSGSGLDCDSGE